MSLREEITNAMSETATTYNTRLNNIADMAGASEDDVRERMKSLAFTDYVDLMRALRDRNEDAIKNILGLVREEYAGRNGTQGSLSPSEMRSQGTQKPQAGTAQKAQAMQRLGKQNLGGATGQQAADAVDKASQGKTLTPVQRKAMAAQATSVDKLASDPRTATQFRNLLNKINK
jgi:hypothetical protein